MNKPSNQELNIEPPAKPRPLSSAKCNWLNDFRCKTRKDRINWNSKLHHRATRFSTKTMYEQAEELMDIVSFLFCILRLTNYIIKRLLIKFVGCK